MADKVELKEVATYGMEQYPEYFGPFPAPITTPDGDITRYKTLMNGVFWAETDTAQEIIAVSYPLWLDVFSNYVMKYSLQFGQNQKNVPEALHTYLFFPKKAMPLALFELQRYYTVFQSSPLINWTALMNTIFREFPDYTVSYNLLEQSGANDMLGLLLHAVGCDERLQGSNENVISITEGAGFRYLEF